MHTNKEDMHKNAQKVRKARAQVLEQKWLEKLVFQLGTYDRILAGAGEGREEVTPCAPTTVGRNFASV